MLKPSSQLSFPMTIRFITNTYSLIISQLPHYNENFNVIHINSMYMPIWMPTKCQTKTEKPKYCVISQFDWLCDVCGCVMSPTSGIYWVELDFINNYKEPQLWLILLRYSANVASAFPWVVIYGIKALGWILRHWFMKLIGERGRN